MQSDASLSWLALALTPGLASRLSARVLRRFDSPDGVFRATLPDLESCHLPAQVAKAIVKKDSFKRAEKELTGVQKIAGCYLLNWTEPKYPQTLLQIYDPPVLLYVRVPGNMTQPVSFAPNQLIKQGAKLAACAEDVIEELPTPIRAALLQAERPEAEQRNPLAAAALNGSEKKLYELLSAEEPVHLDDIVERSGLNSSEVLATLFDLEMKDIIRQLPGKQFSKVLL
jgi:predicted Rossmann fold nucleotide-binding protein DprA/Smf involved in DNA uptake